MTRDDSRSALLAAIVGLAVLFFQYNGWAQSKGPKEGEKAPAWELKDVAGKIHKSTDYFGKVVVLNFWATWCPPCRAEIPDFIRVYTQYKAKDVVFIGVSLDESSAPVKRFVRAHKLNYPVIMGDFKVSMAYGIESIPTTFVIDKKGVIRTKVTQIVSKEALEKAIKPLT